MCAHMSLHAGWMHGKTKKKNLAIWRATTHAHLFMALPCCLDLVHADAQAARACAGHLDAYSSIQNWIVDGPPLWAYVTVML
jgi:hypothetical protein